jgi:anti-sigma B factor antagonist
VLQNAHEVTLADFQIQSSQRDVGGGAARVKVVNVKGQLDAHTFLTLQKELESTLNADDPRLVLDCEGLDYISSAGLGVLKKMVREFRGKGGDIRLARVSDKIDNVMKLLGFSKVIKVYGGLDEAVSSYKPPAADSKS